MSIHLILQEILVTVIHVPIFHGSIILHTIKDLLTQPDAVELCCHVTALIYNTW